jgi:DUF438 domain-containing protein
MWSKLFDLGHRLILLADNNQKLRTDLNTLQKEFKDFAQRIDKELQEMRLAIERLAYEIHHVKEREKYERENYILRLENRLLRAGLNLPPAAAANGE